MKQSDRKFQKALQKSKGNRLLAVVLCISLTLSSFAGISFAGPKKAEAQGNALSNPRIVPDSSMKAGQKVTWDCIWFGSYPQAEVVPANREYTALDKKLLQDGDLIKDDGLYQTLQAATGWDGQGDLVIGGDKYRRIKKEDATYLLSDYHWENGTDYHYFKYQPVKWRVLSVNGSEAFLLADKALDHKQYHTNSGNVTWEGSTIRSWLNGYGASANLQKKDYSSSNFINTAFSASARTAIKDTRVENRDNLSYGTDGGNDTGDKVFLLSKSEVYTDAAKGYGFVSDYGVYDEARRAESSVYAKALGTCSNDSDSYAGNCCWWLRSPGNSGNEAANVNSDGWIHRYGILVYGDHDGVRPALNLNLAASPDAGSPDLWSYAGTVCSDGTVQENGGENEETTITTIRKTPIKQYDSYNVVKYTDTDSGKIIKKAVSYNKAIEDYLSKLNKQASNDVKGSSKQKKSVGKQLMEKDKDVHILKYVLPSKDYENYAIAAYEMLAEYYDECTKTGIVIDKIKITDDYITISSNIIKKVMNRMSSFDKYEKINGHMVHADIFAFGGAISGSSRITVDGTPFIVSSSYNDVAKVMTDYINNLSDITKDVLKQALFSVLTELAHYTYIDQFAEDELKTLFNGKIDSLQKMGYGDLFKVLKGAKKTYNIVRKITAVKSTADLKEALTIDNLKEIYKELSDTDFSDNTIKNETVNSAYKNVIELKKALEDDLFNYIYGYKKEDEGFWQRIKRKININCPVDFTIYDTNNNIMASIINGVAKSNDSNIVLELNGDEKVIYILDERYINIQMTATGDGTMNVAIEDMSDGKPISRLNYYDIKLTDENTYMQELNPDNISGQLNQFPIVSDQDGKINANDYFETTDDASVNIKCTSSEGGYVENDLSETYVKGEPVELYAIPFDGYIFEGWYVGDKLVEISSLYRFTAKGDASVHASFKKKEINYLTSLYDIEYGEKYDDFAWINLYDKNKSAYDVELKMYGIEETDNDVSVLNIAYKKGNATLSQKETVVLNENAEAYLKSVLKKGYESITVTDATGNLVATLLSSGELPDIEILPSTSPDANSTVSPGGVPDNPYMPVIIPTSVPSITPMPSVRPSVLSTASPDKTPEATPSGNPAVTLTPDITPEPSGTPKPDDKKKPVGSLKKGAMVSDSKTKAVYKVTGAGKNKAVEYAGSTKKNVFRITIPAKVKLRGQDYKVTSIAKNAFKNDKKLGYVIIGKYVKKIGKKAFYGCKKLRYIDVRSKKLTAKNIGKQAFGNGYNSPRVKSAKSVWRRYARAFPSRGLSKRAVYIV